MLLGTNRRPVVPLPLAHERGVEAREVADRFPVGEVAQALGERREARLAAHEDGRPDHLAQIKIGRLLGREGPDLGMQLNYARALCENDCATYVTPDDLREAVTTLEEVERTARRVLGGAHPNTAGIEGDLRHARAALRAANLLDGLVYPVDPSWQRHWRVQESTSDR